MLYVDLYFYHDMSIDSHAILVIVISQEEQGPRQKKMVLLPPAPYGNSEAGDSFHVALLLLPNIALDLNVRCVD